MASSPKLFSMSILFLFALFSMQIHAREYFSKFPRVNINEKETTTREQKHETFVPQTTQKPEEQEPRFIPETQNGYGLYGHESGSGSGSGSSRPSFTTKETYEPYVTPVRFHPDEPYNSIPESSNNKDTYYYNKNAYESTKQQNLGEAIFTEKGWSTKENQNNNYYNGNNGYNNGEKQGMSDTRYLENGKYYYDVKSENNYYPNRYHQNQEEFEESEEEFEP
ncbi:hypothetical protein E1A91_A05G170700v1 [Gossypium mustelinum]|uniref:Protein E6 n=1 Tax=Gossypium mustelinum TaxID=34275 RepID=A0A5D2Z895_GOSMU|nr:hypothetical protein E1A91_A05G170700v1 [Gossypium mustelinum]